jgi:CRP-like cAMP-binding protein
MAKPYIAVESGLFKVTVFYLKDLLTIGSDPENDICLNDPSVSSQHAVACYTGQQAILEDLSSRKGTFVNGEPIQKTVISHNDRLRCGDISLRFLEDELLLEQSPASGTGTQSEPERGADPAVQIPSKSSSRLVEVISQIPLFVDLDEEGLAKVAEKARLMVFDQGQTIVRQGDTGTSLYIVLDGKVRVFTLDQEGKLIPVRVLSEGKFFGEMSFLTGAPRSATVKAVENSYLCEINADVLREIIYQWPAVKTTLIKYYKERLAETQNEKKKAGMQEHRDVQRFNLGLPVNFAILSPSRVAEHFKGKVFRCLSTDISLAGVRLKVKDPDLLKLPEGCRLRMQIALPEPWESIRCSGVITNMIEGEKSFDCLGVEFEKLSQSQGKRLTQFLCR